MTSMSPLGVCAHWMTHRAFPFPERARSPRSSEPKERSPEKRSSLPEHPMGTKGQNHGKNRSTHPRPARDVRHRRQGTMVLQMRAFDEPAVLRWLAQARQRRGAREALLVRRNRDAPRGARRVSGHQELLAPVASYQVKLAGREALAEGTLAFRFEKPAGFAFKAGQAIVLERLDPQA